MDPSLANAAGATPDLLFARIQMGFTFAFHIIFASLGVGLPLLLVVAEGIALRTGDAEWRTLARRWARVFAVLFAVGAVSGTVLSFELGLLWPGFMGRFGSVIGISFTLEGFAFFIEAIFFGIYFYAWDRLPPVTHWLTGIPIALSGPASAWFVVTANAWMNTPQGFVLENGAVTQVDPLGAMFSPAMWMQAAHLLFSCYMLAGFVVASCGAFPLLRGDSSPRARRTLVLGLALGVACTPAQIFAGDRAAKMVARTQPVKLAAMEGQFETVAGAPLRIGGLPDESTRSTPYAIEIPGGLSWLATGDATATVRGLNDFPAGETPPTRVVHVAFQIMVAIGTFLLALSAWTLWRAARGTIANASSPVGRIFLWCVVLAGPLSVLAMEAGWIVTEVGRQPWIVQGIMRTSEAMTEAPGVFWSMAAAMVIYTVLGIGTVAVLRLLARSPLPGDR